MCLSCTMKLWPNGETYLYIGHIILKIYAQSWRNLKLYGNNVYNSGLAMRYDIFWMLVVLLPSPRFHLCVPGLFGLFVIKLGF